MYCRLWLRRTRISARYITFLCFFCFINFFFCIWTSFREFVVCTCLTAQAPQLNMCHMAKQTSSYVQLFALSPASTQSTCMVVLEMCGYSNECRVCLLTWPYSRKCYYIIHALPGTCYNTHKMRFFVVVTIDLVQVRSFCTLCVSFWVSRALIESCLLRFLQYLKGLCN